MAASIAATSSGEADSPMQQARHLPGEDRRHHHEQHADCEASGRIPTGLAGHLGEPDADERKHQPDERGDIFEQHHREFGVLGVPDEAPPRLALAADMVRLVHGGPQRERFHDHRREQHADRPAQPFELVGVAQLLERLEDREQSARAEQHERDDERPEVPRRFVAERMLLVGAALGPPAPEHQQRLVAGIGHRVNRFGEHRRGPRERVRDELGDRDAQVRQERGDDRPFRISGHARSLSDDAAAGHGLDVERAVEVGVGHQPAFAHDLTDRAAAAR